MLPAHAFETHRSHLLGVAYRMLGSLAEAEDIVQESWLRWERTEQDGIANPRAFLSRIVTNLCLDQMKSARARREEYVGPWLPDPVAEGVGPDVEAERADSLSVALLLALERLSPLERAAFLLHDIFDMDYPEVASQLGRSEASCRQLAARARAHVQTDKPRFRIAQDEGDRLVDAFLAASQSGETSAFASLLTDDVAFHGDGGGVKIAAMNIIKGADKVARFFLGIVHKSGDYPRRILWRGRINGLPGYVSMERGDTLQSTAFDIEDGRIKAIYIIRNPHKLRHLAQLASSPA
ncbi:MAG: sigma-70 family RNA polymerase sigma factor [Sphingobium phenoxybenzoativorans]|uniref:sigma-70 family RNA polymerase sigma factor n=1 Tax=Sphingobium phenoxybenzoativorans TaxID=1592790 RepID=UPI0008730922|nr:sigma-70 family RNA polymerase sigma factor [Sphingobium phenoxybenzoativorans]